MPCPYLRVGGDVVLGPAAASAAPASTTSSSSSAAAAAATAAVSAAVVVPLVQGHLRVEPPDHDLQEQQQKKYVR